MLYQCIIARKERSTVAKTRMHIKILTIVLKTKKQKGQITGFV